MPRSFRFGTGVGNKLDATIAPKVDGTLALMHLTAGDPLQYFVGFGSLSGRFGGNGLSDYAAANDMLAKLCGWFRQRRPECHTVCFPLANLGRRRHGPARPTAWASRRTLSRWTSSRRKKA